MVSEDSDGVLRLLGSRSADLRDGSSSIKLVDLGADVSEMIRSQTGGNQAGPTLKARKAQAIVVDKPQLRFKRYMECECLQPATPLLRVPKQARFNGICSPG